MTGMKVAVEICEDLWVPNPPSVAHALAGAKCDHQSVSRG